MQATKRQGRRAAALQNGKTHKTEKMPHCAQAVSRQRQLTRNSTRPTTNRMASIPTPRFALPVTWLVTLIVVGGMWWYDKKRGYQWDGMVKEG